MDEDYEPIESPANEVEDSPVTGQFERQLMTLRERKQNFDRLHVDKDKLTSLTLMGYMWYSDESMSTMSQMWKASAVKRCSSKPRYGRICFNYVCDWYPVLFGVDEEVVPSSDDDGEGYFDNLEELRDLEEKAEALTQAELDALRIGSKEDFTEEQLKAAWVKSLLPRYGRRARAKPVLEIPGRPPFECICHIDNRFVRRYIPHFGGGVKRSDQDWRVPHFVAFWEEHHEKTSIPGMAELTKIFESQPKPEEDEAKHLISRPILKFSGTTKSEKKRFREHLFASFRPLDCREIRRYRMPYSEALYLELQEDRFVESAFFFRKLIVKDYYINPLPDNLGTSLRLNKTRLNKLVEFLKVAERFSRRKEYHSEAITLMKIGKYFNDRDESCWWIAEEFYIRAVKVSQMSVLDGKKYEAIARYILGTFLLDFVNRVQLAREHLSKARELSLGKDWNASRILNKTQGPVYKECSNYLCRALIASSIELRENGKSNEALPLIHQSYKLCQEHGRHLVKEQFYKKLSKRFTSTSERF